MADETNPAIEVLEERISDLETLLAHVAPDMDIEKAAGDIAFKRDGTPFLTGDWPSLGTELERATDEVAAQIEAEESETLEETDEREEAEAAEAVAEAEQVIAQTGDAPVQEPAAAQAAAPAAPRRRPGRTRQASPAYADGNAPTNFWVGRR